MNVRKPGLILTARHQTLLKYLFQNKVATYRQLHRDIFGNVKNSIVSRHLGKLMKEQRITKSLISIGDKFTHVYTLDRGAIGILDNCNESELQRNQLQSSAIEHDVQLIELKRRLLMSPSVKAYYTENELQCLPDYKEVVAFAPFLELRSDAVAEVQLKKGLALVPVELEMTQKAASRYEEKVAQYYKWPELRGVLFISANESIERLVSHCERQILNDRLPKFFYAQLKDVITAEREISFQSLSQENFILK